MADRVVIEIATIDEWPQRAQQRTPRVEITGDRPRLDQRIAFPFATMRLVVLLERGGRRRQCAGRTERAQHQVDAKDKTRAEERSVGKEWFRTCRSGWWPD